MSIFLTASFLLGILLSRYFKGSVLAPTSLLIVIALAIVEIHDGTTFLRTAGHAALLLLLLQSGYVLGTIVAVLWTKRKKQRHARAAADLSSQR